MPALVHCIYTSRETHPMSRGEIDSLLTQCFHNNTRRGITGILLHAEGYFMQVLEGTPERIDDLYARILIDVRHTRITRIILEAIPRRYFGASTMGLSTVGHQELSLILKGEDAGKREAILASLDEGRAKKLLRAFIDGRWRQSLTLGPHPNPDANPHANPEQSQAGSDAAESPSHRRARKSGKGSLF